MPVLTKDMVATVVKTGASTRMTVNVEGRFKPGDKVRARNVNPDTHTRLPRYVRGKIGTVNIDHGVFSTPDTVACGAGEHPQHVYNVLFSSAELWGEGASTRDKLTLDLWDDYLEPA